MRLSFQATLPVGCLRQSRMGSPASFSPLSASCTPWTALAVTRLTSDCFIPERFNDEVLVVVQEQAHLRRGVEPGIQPLREGGADGQQRPGREAVEVAGVIGDGQDKEGAFRIASRVEERGAAGAADPAHLLPRVVGQVADLRQGDCFSAMCVPNQPTRNSWQCDSPAGGAQLREYLRSPCPGGRPAARR